MPSDLRQVLAENMEFTCAITSRPRCMVGVQREFH